jgi:hypothetical protein
MYFRKLALYATLLLLPAFAQEKPANYVALPYGYKASFSCGDEFYALASVKAGRARIKSDGKRYYIDGPYDKYDKMEKDSLLCVLREADSMVKRNKIITREEFDKLMERMFKKQ